MGIPAGSTHYQEFSGPNVSLAEAVPGCPAPVVLSAEMQSYIARPDCYDVVFTDAEGNMVPFYPERIPDVWWARTDLPAGETGTPRLRCYVGDAAASDQSNAAGTVAGYAAWLDMSGPGPNFADRVGAYPGTASNIETYNVAGQVDGAARFNGSNSNVNLGDVTQLNSASAFTVSLWANQDVLDAQDILWVKYLDVNNRLELDTISAGNMSCRINKAGGQRGYFDYSAVVSAGAWFHVACVYDGTQAANATRLKLYVSATPQALAFDGTIPTTTANLATGAFTIGYTAVAFDGTLDGVRIHPTSRTASDILAEAQATALLAGGEIVPIAAGFPRRVLWTPRGPDQRLMQPGQVLGPRGRQ